jgi:hypothetical protein
MGGHVASVATVILVGFLAQDERLVMPSATMAMRMTEANTGHDFFICVLLLPKQPQAELIAG